MCLYHSFTWFHLPHKISSGSTICFVAGGIEGKVYLLREKKSKKLPKMADFCHFLLLMFQVGAPPGPAAPRLKLSLDCSLYSHNFVSFRGTGVKESIKDRRKTIPPPLTSDIKTSIILQDSDIGNMTANSVRNHDDAYMDVWKLWAVKCLCNSGIKSCNEHKNTICRVELQCVQFQIGSDDIILLGTHLSSPTPYMKEIWRVDLQNCIQTIWHVTHLEYSFPLVCKHKTYVRSRTNIILLYIMYISPIETLKFNNLDKRIFYKGYSLKKYVIQNE